MLVGALVLACGPARPFKAAGNGGNGNEEEAAAFFHLHLFTAALP